VTPRLWQERQKKIKEHEINDGKGSEEKKIEAKRETALNGGIEAEVLTNSKKYSQPKTTPLLLQCRNVLYSLHQKTGIVRDETGRIISGGH
jgi:inhibitor of KinA sporulation pathway (predicted exonuclease)